MDATTRALMALARAKSSQPLLQLNKVDQSIPLIETNLIHSLTAWFASPDAVKATELPEYVVDLLVASGIKREIAVQVGVMALSKPMSGRTGHGAPEVHDHMTAMRRVASEEPMMRALYVLAASRRLTDAFQDDAFNAALTRENRYLDMHVAAGRNRRRAARKVDALGAQLLVWRTREDNRVEARCAALDRRLFTIDNPPGGVYPGAAHPSCRCYPQVWGSPLFQP